ncbi:MAG: MG2 domain-containing protein [Chitinophagales bacterium]|nr:MG2 domain-containing protein [Chitinophagales bacterium]
MRIAIIAAASFMISLWLSSCNSRNKVNLLATNATGEVPVLGNLNFTFDKNLAPDSLLNEWDATQYVKFDPPIEGSFRWENPNQLVFSPQHELKPATVYTARITSEILKYSQKLSLGNCPIQKFNTAPLKLEQAVVYWNLNDGQLGNAFPQVDLYFNYNVSPEELKSHLKVSASGQSSALSFLSNTPDKKISLSIVGLKPEDKDVPVSIQITKGMKPVAGNTATASVLETNALLASPFNLSILNTEADHDGATGSIRVYCSQSPVENILSSYLTINPAVKYRVRATTEGFMITSDDFELNREYTLTIKKGLKGKLGGTLANEYETSLGFGSVEPTIAFANQKAVYLGSKGARNIELRIFNVPKIRVIISKIYENNLVHSKRYYYEPRDYHGEEEDYYDYDSYETSQLGDVIYNQEYETKNLPRYGSNRLIRFNFEDKLRNFKGIYHIRVQSSSQYWLSDSRYISLSDIGLIARLSSDKLYVFANSIATAEPMGSVTVNLIAKNNQQLATGKTGSDGVAILDLPKTQYSGFKGALITASSGNDFNYMHLRSSEVNISRFETGGKRSNLSALDCFIYGDRELYRPGEKINLNVIVREKNWNTPGEIPLKMKLLLPNGRELKTIRKVTNSQGSAEVQFDLASSSITGAYTLQVLSGSDVLIGSKNVWVEEFMPDRIKVEAEADKAMLKPGETTNLQIRATNFFGPPAANRNYELEIQLARKPFTPARYSHYNFTLSGKETYFENIVREGKTNEEGKATESYTVPEQYRDMGIIKATFFTTVFDENGRPVNRAVQTDVLTQDVFYGIAAPERYWLPVNQTVKLPVIALNRAEAVLQNQTAQVQVMRLDYRTVLSRYGEYFRYESQPDFKTILNQQISVSGENTFFSFVPRVPGEYEVRIMRPGAPTYTSCKFYCYGGYGHQASFAVNNEGHIDIEPDKGAYKTGEKVRVLFKTPFDGKMLVTVESDKVMEYRYLTTNNRTATYEFTTSQQHLPNVYVTATLFKPHKESDMPLVVAHGFQSLTVEEPARKMPVEILAEKQVRSHTHQKVRVKAPAGSMVTLAAVDEGILQVTDYKTPDPHGYFYAKRALEVTPYDIYPLLFPELRGNVSSIAGDGFDLSKRTNPLQNNRVKLVSYWSGVSEINASGEAGFEFDIPQFSGELRLMAVAYKDNSFGSDEERMRVSDPVVVSTALPRFISPGDTVRLFITATNTTKSNTQAKIQISASPEIRVVGSGAQSVSLPAGNEARSEFLLVAQPAPGRAKVTVRLNAGSESYTDETDITIRPAASLVKLTEAGSIEAGKSKQLTTSEKFYPGSEDYYLIVAKNPLLGLGKEIYHLINYPYGCTEQVVSAAFPQLYAADIADLMRAESGIKQNANYHVMEAIRQIKTRQLYNGGITLWEHGGSENWWASVYAAHFLHEARKAGFDVDKNLTDQLHAYLIAKLKNRETHLYYYNRGQQRKIAPREVIYSLYVLALTGNPQTSAMNYYKQNLEQLAPDSRYMLSAAFALAGDKASFNALLPAAFGNERSDRETGGSFSSPVRDEALALSAILEAEPGHPQVGVMARHLSEELQKNEWLSTQDRAFSFVALGKLARHAAQSQVTATIKVNGKTISQNDGSLVKLSSKQLGGNKVEISVTGNGKLYYFWQAEGIPADGKVREEDSYIKVRKRFFDRNGNIITGNTFKQNDLIIVGITLENAYSRTVDNIVITDMLPAGFEVENPRTSQIPGMNWIKNESSYEHLDLRDDRIHIFTSAGPQVKNYYYAVRAVTPGAYTMGPVMADAMYDGSYHSYHGAGTVRVLPR